MSPSKSPKISERKTTPDTQTVPRKSEELQLFESIIMHNYKKTGGALRKSESFVLAHNTQRSSIEYMESLG